LFRGRYVFRGRLLCSGVKAKRTSDKENLKTLGNGSIIFIQKTKNKKPKQKTKNRKQKTKCKMQKTENKKPPPEQDHEIWSRNL
jgi:hypothetical protein